MILCLADIVTSGIVFSLPYFSAFKSRNEWSKSNWTHSRKYFVNVVCPWESHAIYFGEEVLVWNFCTWHIGNVMNKEILVLPLKGTCLILHCVSSRDPPQLSWLSKDPPWLSWLPRDPPQLSWLPRDPPRLSWLSRDPPQLSWLQMISFGDDNATLELNHL